VKLIHYFTLLSLFMAFSAFGMGHNRSQSGSSQSEPITFTDEQTKNIADVQRNCVERDWSKVQCERKAPVDDRYLQDGTSNADSLADKVLGSIPNLFNRLDSAKQNQAEAIYSQLIQMLRATKEKNQLSDCQTACLATCASSSYANYDYDAISDVNNSTTGILVDGKGVCENFATLANRFAGDLGLTSKKEFGEGSVGAHTFLGVQLDGQWDFFEPESADCAIIGSSN
jgi:hypothetical protein